MIYDRRNLCDNFIFLSNVLQFITGHDELTCPSQGRHIGLPLFNMQRKRNKNEIAIAWIKAKCVYLLLKKHNPVRKKSLTKQ